MLETTYDLSIIIPHYNAPEELSRLLDSIGCRENVQILVVDDGSDRRLEELEACRRAHPQVLFLETESGKKGPGAARNAALPLAAGRWLLFADCDDLFLPGWYELLSPYLDSDCDLVYFAPVSRRKDGGPSDRHARYAGLVDRYLNASYGGEEQLRGRFSVPWSKLVRSSLVEENHILFDEILYSADVMFSAKVGYHAERIAAVRTPFYCVIDREDSLSQARSGDVYLRRQKVYCERDAFFRSRYTKKQLQAYGRMSFLHTAKDAREQGYDWKTVAALRKLYRAYGIPFAVVNLRRHAERLRDRFSPRHPV